MSTNIPLGPTLFQLPLTRSAPILFLIFFTTKKKRPVLRCTKICSLYSSILAENYELKGDPANWFPGQQASKGSRKETVFKAAD